MTAERSSDRRLPPGTAIATFHGTDFLEGHDNFAIFVAGNDIGLLFVEHGAPYVVERVAPGVYVTFVGTGSALAAAGQFAGAFRGTVHYCSLSTPTDDVIGGGYAFMCPQPIASADCESKNHRFTLSRR